MTRGLMSSLLLLLLLCASVPAAIAEEGIAGVSCSIKTMYTTSPEDSGDAIALKFYPDADAAEIWGWVVSCNEQLQVLYAGSTQVQWDVPQDLELVIPDVVTTLMAVSETDVTPALTTQCGCTPTISVESGISIWTGVKQWNSRASASQPNLKSQS
eukprot:gene19824-26511_t